MECENCKYKDFYEKYKVIAEYVEEEAKKRLVQWLKEGKLVRKPELDGYKNEKSKEILRLLSEYGRRLQKNEDSDKNLDEVISEMYEQAERGTRKNKYEVKS